MGEKEIIRELLPIFTAHSDFDVDCESLHDLEKHINHAEVVKLISKEEKEFIMIHVKESKKRSQC